MRGVVVAWMAGCILIIGGCIGLLWVANTSAPGDSSGEGAADAQDGPTTSTSSGASEDGTTPTTTLLPPVAPPVLPDTGAATATADGTSLPGDGAGTPAGGNASSGAANETEPLANETSQDGGDGGEEGEGGAGGDGSGDGNGGSGDGQNDGGEGEEEGDDDPPPLPPAPAPESFDLPVFDFSKPRAEPHGETFTAKQGFTGISVRFRIEPDPNVLLPVASSVSITVRTPDLTTFYVCGPPPGILTSAFECTKSGVASAGPWSVLYDGYGPVRGRVHVDLS